MQISSTHYSAPLRTYQALSGRENSIEAGTPQDLVDIGNSPAHQGDYDQMGKVLGGMFYGAIGAGVGGTIGGIVGGSAYGVGGGLGLAAAGVLIGGSVGAYLGSR